MNGRVNEGQPAKVNCTASGKPLPAIELTVTTDVQITTTQDVYDEPKTWLKKTFSLMKLTKDMKLTCTATNVLDKKSATLTPAVFGKCELSDDTYMFVCPKITAYV